MTVRELGEALAGAPPHAEVLVCCDSGAGKSVQTIDDWSSARWEPGEPTVTPASTNVNALCLWLEDE